jgi:hypothetical protein
MSSIRDLLTSLRDRAGVDAAVVVGRDGLVVDSEPGAGIDAEHVAAHVPALLVAGNAFGLAAERGDLVMAVVEHERGGLAVVTALTPEVVLIVFVNPAADVGPLLYELRHERDRLAALV